MRTLNQMVDEFSTEYIDTLLRNSDGPLPKGMTDTIRAAVRSALCQFLDTASITEFSELRKGTGPCGQH